MSELKNLTFPELVDVASESALNRFVSGKGDFRSIIYSACELAARWRHERVQDPTPDDTGKVLLTKEQWEEAQRDKARLDWLTENSVYAASEKPVLELVIPSEAGSSGNLPKFVREVIDSAMNADTKGTSA